MSIISQTTICNMCGRYQSKGDYFNTFKVDLNNFFIKTHSIIFKDPILEIHFCNKCYAGFIESDLSLKHYGELGLLEKIKNLKKEKEQISDDFEMYKFKISSLIVNNKLET